ncbi:hypothetical protein GGX14DRAFT_385476 [Mycena pura]|uniref:Uncharacterized protein n=1 Tax=Mycena pura TaxID=153505 RepID=A0AAD6YUA7_9AGAR|nr:hypothetical protein GGX14DRAFT_385476 [Mycena pura]
MPPTAPSHPCGYARNPEPLTHSQLMVVYPASWSICIIGPAWSLIVLYFAPALVLWRIGTPVGSQALPANPVLAPRYTDGTPRAHPSPVQSSSVFRVLHLLATSSFCLRHRISARFHPASLPDPFPRPLETNARLQPIAFSRLLRYCLAAVVPVVPLTTEFHTVIAAVQPLLDSINYSVIAAFKFHAASF